MNINFNHVPGPTMTITTTAVLSDIQQFDKLVYNGDETVRIELDAITQLKWASKGNRSHIKGFGLSCISSRCWIRTIGIHCFDGEMSFLGMQLQVSAQYDDYLLICLEERITRSAFLDIHYRLEKIMGEGYRVCKSSEIIPYPVNIEVLGKRMSKATLEQILR